MNCNCHPEIFTLKGIWLTCTIRSERFGVTLQFLQQQVAWLYERQLTQARAQMRKAPQQLQIHSNSPSPAPGSVAGSTALGGQPQRPPVAGMYSNEISVP